MAEPQIDYSVLDQARQALRETTDARQRLLAELAASSADLRARLRAANRAEEPEAVNTRLEQQLANAWQREQNAKEQLAAALLAWLPQNEEDDAKRLSADYPIVLLPTRIETRFDPEESKLKVRIYPDAIAADFHDPTLTEAEADAAADFRKSWNSGNEAARRNAWRLLVAQFPAPRAAWIVRATASSHPAEDASAESQAAATRLQTWSGPAETRVLPDRWLVLAFRPIDQELRRCRTWSEPVAEPLQLTLNPNPNPDPSRSVNVSDNLKLDRDVHWTIDFREAEKKGMAVRVPIEQTDLEQGFARLIVLGVKSSLRPEAAAARLEELLDAHHYTRGLAFVAQGSPTNNANGIAAAYPPDDTDGNHSYQVELEQALNTPTSDGTRFMRALGLSPELAAHLDRADRTEHESARAMNNALWPGTLGYFLTQMMASAFGDPPAPALGRDTATEVRRYFVDWVSGRGPFPAFRVGAVPYGLLPVTSLNHWVASAETSQVETEILRMVRTLRSTWLGHASDVPHIGRNPADPDTDLLETLAMEASAREVRVRHADGWDFRNNLYQGFGADWRDWSRRVNDNRLFAMTLIGYPQLLARAAFATFAEQAYRYRLTFVSPLWPPAGPQPDVFGPLPLVTDELSEQQTLQPSNYINAIHDAVANGSFDDLRKERFSFPRPRALCYRILRHSALLEYADAALAVSEEQGVADPSERVEPELVGFATVRAQPTIWTRLEGPIPSITGARSLGQFIAASSGRPAGTSLDEFTKSLSELAPLPTAELERLFTETIDCCSHRLDAWITSLPTKRLEELRRAHPKGVHLGAFGWVENLHPRPVGEEESLAPPDGQVPRTQADSGGYVQAPTMMHAAAAAVLRSGYLTRAGEARTRYAIDLSSARVRGARWLLDNLRAGQPLGALLGYRFERALHERDLDKYIDPFRQSYPLVAGKGDDSPDSGAAEAIAARNVVDGLALLNGGVPAGAAGSAFPFSGTADRDAIDEELHHLEEHVDAVADLLTAEAVYQIVRGSMGGAAASLDALAQGVRPPDPEIARPLRSGTAVTHRVAVVIGGTALEPPAGWPGAPTPRAQAEISLDRWVGYLLGDPRGVGCRVSYLDPDSAGLDGRSEQEVTLADLELRPLDVLALARGFSDQQRASELDQRIAMAVLSKAPKASEITIIYAAREGADHGYTRTFPEILTVAQAINALLGGARALRPEDLLLPEEHELLRPEGQLPQAALQRAEDALQELSRAGENLTSAISGAAFDVNELRKALWPLSLFGISGALVELGVSVDEALSRAKAVQSEVERRRQEAEKARTDGGPTVEKASAIVEAIFGRDFVFLPAFQPSSPEELGNALDPQLIPGSAPERAATVTKWLQQAERVRPSLERWRTLALLTQALGAEPARFDVAQLPAITGEQWVALPFQPEAEPPRSGRISLVLHRPVSPTPQEPWAGLLLDEWTEIIPARSDITGLAFHYDTPGNEAPQAVLLAVSPTSAPTWDLETLIDTLTETLDLTKIRAVDGELIDELAQLLPAIYLAANADGDTVSTDFSSDDLVIDAIVRTSRRR